VEELQDFSAASVSVNFKIPPALKVEFVVDPFDVVTKLYLVSTQ
jgi:hypothetical protein